MLAAPFLLTACVVCLEPLVFFRDANEKLPTVNDGKEYVLIIIDEQFSTELSNLFLFSFLQQREKKPAKMCCSSFLKIMMFIFNGGIFVSFKL